MVNFFPPRQSALLRLARSKRPILLLLLATSGMAQAQAPVTFATVTTYSIGTGSYPSGIAVADVNGDNKPDLLTANSGSTSPTINNNAAGVLLGTGTGSFGSVTTYSSGVSPRGIAVADVNGDNKPDLLTVNSGSGGTVGVLLGTGTGSFGVVTTYSTGVNSSPYAIAVADVNGDGKPDLLTANSSSSSSTVGVLLGTGTGSFGVVTTYSAGVSSSPSGIAVADVNGDGKLDLLTANTGSNSAGVLLGTGTGSFGVVTTYSTGVGSSPYSIAVADVNGDGKPDLLTANYNGNAAGVLLGTSTGSFGVVTTYSTGAGPISIAVADVNRDGSVSSPSK